MAKKTATKKPKERRPTELRAVRIRRNVSAYAEGSVLIEQGETQVRCTATVERRVPEFLRDTGRGWVTAEYSMLPRATLSRTPRESVRGQRTGRTQEISRLIGRSLRCAMDLSQLGEYTITVDCDVLQADGGTRCASITGGMVALAEALNWMRRRSLLKGDPLKRYIAAVSVGLVDGTPWLDLAYEQDCKADVDMNVVMTDDGRFVELQGTAESEPFSEAQLDELKKLARKGIVELLALQKKALRIKG